MSDHPLLEVDRLEKHFDQDTNIVETLLNRKKEKVKAVDDVSFTLGREDVTGVIGESGCGKSTLLRTLIGLYEPTGGTIRFKGRDLSTFSKRDWKEFRSDVQIIFQDPFNSLDPKFTVRDTLEERLIIHGMEVTDRAIAEALEQVKLTPPEKYLERLPRQLSGGEKQRVAIARALIVDPELILADEPVSMLDVSTQAAVLNLLSDLIDNLGLSMVYISHDLSTVSHICDNVNVMYLGRIVERAPTKPLLNDPKHPYSQALIDAIPIPDPHVGRERTSIDGSPQDPIGIGEGCRFRDRCPERMDVCEKSPVFYDLDGDDVTDRHVACHLYYDHDELARQPEPQPNTLD
jgi:peptide/nickel transport system ATP-binding protein